MNIVFFGSSEFSIPFVAAFKHEIKLVVTSTDKMRGRGKIVLPNPVKEFALKENLPVIGISKFKDQEFEIIKSTKPDIFIVVSYGKIIPQEILLLVNCPINLHPSKLPRYRGAAPIERQIMDGVVDSAICIMKVVKELDAGDIIIEQAFQILPYETKGDVEKKVTEIGIPLLKKAIELISRGECDGRKQKGVPTYANKITKADELIDWNFSAMNVFNKIRALNPKPGAFTYFRSRTLKIFKAEISSIVNPAVPGTITHVFKDYFNVACEKDGIKILELQIEGGNRMSAKDFINGFKIKVGETFGDGA
jgi:methionyl-tRNA formyltransferase